MYRAGTARALAGPPARSSSLSRSGHQDRVGKNRLRRGVERGRPQDRTEPQAHCLPRLEPPHPRRSSRLRRGASRGIAAAGLLLPAPGGALSERRSAPAAPRPQAAPHGKQAPPTWPLGRTTPVPHRQARTHARQTFRRCKPAEHLGGERIDDDGPSGADACIALRWLGGPAANGPSDAAASSSMIFVVDGSCPNHVRGFSDLALPAGYEVSRADCSCCGEGDARLNEASRGRGVARPLPWRTPPWRAAPPRRRQFGRSRLARSRPVPSGYSGSSPRISSTKSSWCGDRRSVIDVQGSRFYP